MTGSPWRLDGRVALLAGSGRGIGMAIAKALADAGARVAINGMEREGDELRGIVAGIPGAVALPLDLGAPGTGVLLAERATALLGPPDILVLGAAIQIEGDWDAATPDAMDAQWRVNLREALTLTQAVVPGMCERGWGRVLGIASVQHVKPHPQMMVYAALKAGLTNALRNLAKQIAPTGVTVNTIAPGAIATPRNADRLADPAQAATVHARIPMGRVGTAEECAAAALFLCSPAASYVTGVDLLVDGGLAL
jgi:NAD(P)-dependent dehydrogenase (short-subunit alcohol dehydrogenase family)